MATCVEKHQDVEQYFLWNRDDCVYLMPLVVAQTLGRVVSDLDGSVTKVQSVVEPSSDQLDREKVHGLAGVKHYKAVGLESPEHESVGRAVADIYITQ